MQVNLARAVYSVRRTRTAKVTACAVELHPSRYFKEFLTHTDLLLEPGTHNVARMTTNTLQQIRVFIPKEKRPMYNTFSRTAVFPDYGACNPHRKVPGTVQYLPRATFDVCPLSPLGYI